MQTISLPPSPLPTPCILVGEADVKDGCTFVIGFIPLSPNRQLLGDAVHSLSKGLPLGLKPVGFVGLDESEIESSIQHLQGKIALLSENPLDSSETKCVSHTGGELVTSKCKVKVRKDTSTDFCIFQAWIDIDLGCEHSPQAVFDAIQLADPSDIILLSATDGVPLQSHDPQKELLRSVRVAQKQSSKLRRICGPLRVKGDYLCLAYAKSGTCIQEVKALLLKDLAMSLQQRLKHVDMGLATTYSLGIPRRVAVTLNGLVLAFLLGDGPPEELEKQLHDQLMLYTSSDFTVLARERSTLNEERKKDGWNLVCPEVWIFFLIVTVLAALLAAKLNVLNFYSAVDDLSL